MSRGRTIGEVVSIHRHPVKSMAGESLAESSVEERFGITGDRAWAIRDLTAGEIRGAKKIPELLLLAARYVDEPRSEASALVEIDLGARDGLVRSDDPDVSERLSRRLGRAVTLCPRLPADDSAHYRRARPITDPEAEIREASGLLPEEPMPVMGDAPVDLSIVGEYVSPPGTYFDFFDLHLLSTRSLASLAARRPDSVIDPRRFRPNFLVELEPAIGSNTDDWPEQGWIGRTIAVGGVRVSISMPMMRCGMTTHAQPGLPKDPGIMRTLVRDCGMNLGVGVQVLRGGRVRTGDAIRVVDA